MKAYLKNFSISNNLLVDSCSELEEVICNRQEKFKGTAKYQEAKKEAMEVLRKIETQLPEEGRAFRKLEELFFWMECICFSAAYRDGMNDLMAAMTFSKLNLVDSVCFDVSSNGAQSTR